MKPNLQHAIERVERPGGSHEGVGRKKSFQVLHGVVVASIEVFFLFLVSCHAL